MQVRADYREVPGGDLVQIMQTKAALEKLGVTVDLSAEEAPDLSSYDLVHAFCLSCPEPAYQHTLHAAVQGKPIALSTIYADHSEIWEWGQPEHWELPDPAEGLPVPHQAPLARPDRTPRHRPRIPAPTGDH